MKSSQNSISEFRVLWQTLNLNFCHFRVTNDLLYFQHSTSTQYIDNVQNIGSGFFFFLIIIICFMIVYLENVKLQQNYEKSIKK